MSVIKSYLYEGGSNGEWPLKTFVQYEELFASKTCFKLVSFPRKINLKESLTFNFEIHLVNSGIHFNRNYQYRKYRLVLVLTAPFLRASLLRRTSLSPASPILPSQMLSEVGTPAFKLIPGHWVLKIILLLLVLPLCVLLHFIIWLSLFA